ncbi:AAA family ATPase, partial [Ursidibacter arcticus]
ISEDIIANKNLKDFQTFLNECGINYELVTVKNFNKQNIGIKMGDKVLSFFDIVSTGTLSLTFFYYWWQSIKKNKIPLLFIDEFDCSYHFALSEKIVEKLKELPNTQVILTTHNTNLLSNELIRPDCGFVIDGKQIKSLNNLTQKELREVHNLEKLYQAGHFNNE